MQGSTQFQRSVRGRDRWEHVDKRTEMSLSRRVTNDRDAITDKPSSQSTAMRFPMFSCQYSQELQRKAACVWLGKRCGTVSRNSQDSPRDACGWAAAVDVPKERTCSCSRVALSRASAAVKETLVGDKGCASLGSKRARHGKLFSSVDERRGWLRRVDRNVGICLTAIRNSHAFPGWYAVVATRRTMRPSTEPECYQSTYNVAKILPTLAEILAVTVAPTCVASFVR